MKNYCKLLFFVFTLTALIIAPNLHANAMDIMNSTMNDNMMGHLDSPRKQMKMGVDIHKIQCKSGYELVFKSINWLPSCVKSSSVAKLVEIGWASSHIPSEDEMMMK
jgi:hypothetical protein